MIMSRIPNKHGGGAATNANGLLFEQTTSLNSALDANGYKVSDDGKVYNSKGLFLGYSKSKYSFRKFLEECGVDLSVNSDILLPDDAFINSKNNTVYIIEKKFQSGSGSVSEKIQTCEYKKIQYKKLVSQIGYQVEYIYILSDFFDNPKFADVLHFIESKGCHYYFNELPLRFLHI